MAPKQQGLKGSNVVRLIMMMISIAGPAIRLADWLTHWL